MAKKSGAQPAYVGPIRTLLWMQTGVEDPTRILLFRGPYHTVRAKYPGVVSSALNLHLKDMKVHGKNGLIIPAGNQEMRDVIAGLRGEGTPIRMWNASTKKVVLFPEEWESRAYTFGLLARETNINNGYVGDRDPLNFFE